MGPRTALATSRPGRRLPLRAERPARPRARRAAPPTRHGGPTRRRARRGRGHPTPRPSSSGSRGPAPWPSAAPASGPALRADATRRGGADRPGLASPAPGGRPGSRLRAGEARAGGRRATRSVTAVSTSRGAGMGPRRDDPRHRAMAQPRGMDFEGASHPCAPAGRPTAAGSTQVREGTCGPAPTDGMGRPQARWHRVTDSMRASMAAWSQQSTRSLACPLLVSARMNHVAQGTTMRQPPGSA